MMRKMMVAGPDDTGPGETENAHVGGKPEVDAVYYLHFLADGTLQRFEEEPFEKPTLRIELCGDWEFTKTKNHLHTIDGGYAWKQVKPRGVGWAVWDGAHDKWTEWRRLLNEVVE